MFGVFLDEIGGRLGVSRYLAFSGSSRVCLVSGPLNTPLFGNFRKTSEHM